MNFFLKTVLAVFAAGLIIGTFLLGGTVLFTSHVQPEAPEKQNQPSPTQPSDVIPIRQSAERNPDAPEPSGSFAVPQDDGSITRDDITKTPEKTLEAKIVLFKVPFTPQAPFGKWSDDRQQDGCEEASALMAVHWARGLPLSLQQAEQEILALSEFERGRYGGYHDTSAEDTALRILRGYFEYTTILVRNNITRRDIIDELNNGNLVIVPVNGRKLGNPYYTPPGPIRHQLVVIGYDEKTDEFITNDPGTKRGAGFRYRASVLEGALQDYPTGHKEPITSVEKRMIVVTR